MVARFLTKVILSRGDEFFRERPEVWQADFDKRVSAWHNGSSSAAEGLSPRSLSLSVSKILGREESRLDPSLPSLHVGILSDTTKLLRSHCRPDKSSSGKPQFDQDAEQSIRDWVELMSKTQSSRLFAHSRDEVQMELNRQVKKLTALLSADRNNEHGGLAFFEPHMFFLDVAETVNKIGSDGAVHTVCAWSECERIEWERLSGQLVTSALGLDTHGLPLLANPDPSRFTLAGVRLPYDEVREKVFDSRGEMKKVPDAGDTHTLVMHKLFEWINKRGHKAMGELTSEDGETIMQLKDAFDHRAGQNDGLQKTLELRETQRRHYVRTKEGAGKEHSPRRPVKKDFERDIHLLGKRSHYHTSPVKNSKNPRKRFRISFPALFDE